MGGRLRGCEVEGRMCAIGIMTFLVTYFVLCFCATTWRKTSASNQPYER
jgi:hypothetical protein